MCCRAVNITTQIYTQHDSEGQEEYGKAIYIFGRTALNPDFEPEMSHTSQKNGAIGDDTSFNPPSVNKIADDELSRV